ncbi:nuclear transport factor 2 family protein [Catenulispora sp. NF23]|uniref:nuclear transport factor 2 family protein n=1 Tax=Catenulispora pinistramenti TaxID=2705254 RepID=UPI001BA93624|nr:nuclear transport factor 2 family protein [Catenulispora pinistramenti]MBS2536515.1 nuclear transport factor 2 family protein [Catenulispora pinistramenti]
MSAGGYGGGPVGSDGSEGPDEPGGPEGPDELGGPDDRGGDGEPGGLGGPGGSGGPDDLGGRDGFGDFGEFEEEFGGFGPGPDGPPPQVTADIGAITEANEEFYAAAEAGDLDRLGAIWLAGPFEASVQCVHPGWAPVFGREDVLRSWAVVCANTPFLQFFLTDVRIDVVDRIAVVSLTENIITDMSAGSSEEDPGFIAGGRATTINIFRRTDEGWRLWMHHASAVMESVEE